MGEYAIRVHDGEEIKIGTCEMMYYLRYEDQDKVKLLPGQSFGDFWRLPFPDEDKVWPGQYEKYNRGQRLYKVHKSETRTGQDWHEDFCSNDLDPGNVQLSHNCGLLVNMPCHHGAKLPEAGPGQRIFWNGKSWFFELCWIKKTAEGFRFTVQCIHCRTMFSFTWDEIKDWIPEGELKNRLEKYR